MTTDPLEVQIATLRPLLEAGFDPAMIVDTSNHIRFWNRAAQNVLQWSAGEVVGRDVASALQASCPIDPHKRSNQLDAAGSPVTPSVTYCCKDGKPMTFDCRSLPLDGSAGCLGIVEFFRPRDSLYSDETFRLAQRCADAGTWERDLATNKERWSEEYYALYGIDPTAFEPSYENWLRAVHPDDRALVAKSAEDAVEKHANYSVEFRVVRPDGEIRWICEMGRTLFDSRGHRRMMGLAFDITKRKLVEEELGKYRDHLEELVEERALELKASHDRLRMVERMAAIGTLSAGLGHDMGNILLPIRLRLDGIQSKTFDSDLRDDVVALRGSIEYLQKLSNGLRLLALDSEKTDMTQSSTIVDEWWSEVFPLYKNILPHGIQLKHDLTPNLPPIRIEPHRLTQLVFNLVQNAGDAMRKDSRGEVCITAKLLADRHKLQLSVSDNGPGMSDEVRRRCFEPFFTTKSRGMSTGMGLALVHGLVTAAGGTIDIKSQPKSGTQFIINLPVQAESISRVPENSAYVAVSIGDPRARAYVNHVLGSLMPSVKITSLPDRAEIKLWIVDGPNANARDLLQYLRGGKTRRVILMDDTDPKLNGERSIVAVGSKPSPARIREAIFEVAVAAQLIPAKSESAARSQIQG
ncbi:MAG: PAS domain-containing sensor histidine kinase [Oligoflexia bacterium]|nr:PAS domain-containing sensor histidine kinase [Oligoflexia bacterium]